MDFVESHYAEINKALNIKYKTNLVFPNYIDVLTCIKDYLNEPTTTLKLSEAEIENEAKHCFIKMGELLQRRRKRELHISLSHFDVRGPDPAQNNPEMLKQLAESKNIFEKKIDELTSKYTNLQETQPEEPPSDEGNSSSSECSEEED